MDVFCWTGHVMRPGVLTLLCMLRWFCLATGGQRGADTHIFYAVELEGGSSAARALAQKHGLRFISRIGNLEGHYTLKGNASSPTLDRTLALHTGVKWVQRQNTHHRTRRAATAVLHNNTHYEFAEHSRQKQSGRGSTQSPPDSLYFNDPLWPDQWELFNHGQVGSSVFDLNVMPVWLRNITGRGVVVSIIDDGLDHSNLDLKKNFEAFASFDLRGSHGLSHDPMPLRNEENGHGTKCAGEVAMEANNSYCGVGIAFNARIGGIRLLDGSVTDSMEASALTYNNDFIHIYTCCWGPTDNGAEMSGPSTLTEKALHLGTRKGRGGKGSVFVWAAGNGGLMDDHCGADGYVNSIYTIAIGAVTHTGSPASFGEPCPAVMAVTLTGTNTSPPLVTVSNLGDGCITNFAGTSSAAPTAAGVLALVLEANPDLTWRDVQHLITRTAKIPDPNQPGWIVNGAGYHVHDRYGFGLLDAALMVQKAVNFDSVADQRKCEQTVTLQPVQILPAGGEVSVAVQSEACRGQHNELNTLEHVQVTVNISSVCRGDLSVQLVSPAQTSSLLLGTRSNDHSAEGLKSWTLMSVQNWGENPQGTWRLTVKDHKGTAVGCSRSHAEHEAGAILNITLTLYGTYNPNTTNHAAPLRGFVSLGELHTLPVERVSVRNHFPPQDLIHRAFRLEQGSKVTPEDIPHTPKHSKKPEVGNFSDSEFSLTDMDDTDGEGLRSHLMKLWNTLRNKVQVDQAHNSTLRHSNTQHKVQMADTKPSRSFQSDDVADVWAAQDGTTIERHLSIHVRNIKHLTLLQQQKRKRRTKG